MHPAEREKIVRMEMKRFASQGEADGVISFWPAGKVKENGSNKEYLLCAEMPRATSEALISAIREKKFNLIGLTSHPQLASYLLKECQLAGASNPALVEVNEHEGSITLFHSNIWNMERQFLIGVNALAGSETPAALDTDKLRLEVGRALQYFKQQVRNENISQIFLYGTTSRESLMLFSGIMADALASNARSCGLRVTGVDFQNNLIRGSYVPENDRALDALNELPGVEWSDMADPLDLPMLKLPSIEIQMIVISEYSEVFSFIESLPEFPASVSLTGLTSTSDSNEKGFRLKIRGYYFGGAGQTGP